MTFPPPEFPKYPGVRSNPSPPTATSIFDAAQKPVEWRGDGARIALLCPEARVVHATAAALALFGAKDLAEIEGRLAAGEGPTARRVRYLAAAEPIGQAMRREPLRLPIGRRTKRFNMLCARIAGAQSAVFLILSIPDPEGGAVQPEQSVVPAVGFDAFDPLNLAEVPVSSEETDSDGGAPDGAAVATAKSESSEGINSGSMAVQELAGAQVEGGSEFARSLDANAFVGDSAEIAQRRETRSPIGRIADAVARLLGARASDVAPPPDVTPLAAPAAASGEPQRAEIVVLRQASAPSAAHANVVPIRPGALDAPNDFTKISQSVELSKSERDAFREIARALVGRAPLSRDDRSSDANSADPSHGAHGPLDLAMPAAFAPGCQVRLYDSEAVDDEALNCNAQAILDRLPIGVLIVRDAQPLYLNQPLLDLLGYRDLAHFHEADGVATIFHGRDPRPLSMTASGVLQIVKADGRSFAAEGCAQAIVWDREPATLITLRHVGETAGAGDGEANDLRQMLDRAADGVVILDSEARVVSLNRSAERLFGCESGEVAGQSLRALLAPQSQAEAIGRFERLCRSNESDSQERLLHVAGRGKDGATLALELTLARIGLQEAPRYCALLRDLSRERDREQRLTAARDAALASSVAKTDFLNKVSHEIRTPLHAILGIAEVMMEGRFGPIGNERYRDYLKDIYSSGRYMMSIADDLLDLNKIESGRLDLAFAPVDANSLIRECVSLMQPQAARERIIMRLNLFERLQRVIVDERSLKQIMLNLISNAVKFNVPGGQVIVSTAVDAAGQAVIRVRDTGAGMSENEVGLAFEPFSQVGNAGRKGGTGLGLPLTKALVEANKAELTIKSRHQQGTLIELAFPKVQAAQ